MCISKFFIRKFNKFIAEDEFGNQYFMAKNKTTFGKSKRFVIYNGENEGSKVPPMWHSWLHYLSDDIPSQGKNFKYQWQKKHEVNKTGTNSAYTPVRISDSPKKSYYNSWRPN